MGMVPFVSRSLADQSANVAELARKAFYVLIKPDH
jgi:hypothetical protein